MCCIASYGKAVDFQRCIKSSDRTSDAIGFELAGRVCRMGLQVLGVSSFVQVSQRDIWS